MDVLWAEDIYLKNLLAVLSPLEAEVIGWGKTVVRQRRYIEEKYTAADTEPSTVLHAPPNSPKLVQISLSRL
ncbi:hypothetical protein FRB95_004127 [Tulasnella sp. JGI-2019a]|nr:hypothetical protein FRB95_004127 [Tulasnella sp. JGI-2019a]